MAQAAAAPGLNTVRQLLMGAGLLPPRDVRREAMTNWLHDCAASLDEGPDASVVRAYIEMEVLRLDGLELTPCCEETLRIRVRAILAFYAYIHEAGSELTTLEPHVLERFASERTAHDRQILAGHVRWLRRRGLTTLQLEYPPRLRGVSRPTRPNPDTALRIRSLLESDELPLAERTMAALVALQGLSLARLIRLHVDDVILGEQGGVHLQCGPRLVTLHTTLATLVLEQVKAVRERGAVNTVYPPFWLFPGIRAGRHISHTVVVHHLRARGFPIQALRNAARLALAERLDPKALGRRTGMGKSACLEYVYRLDIDTGAPPLRSRRPRRGAVRRDVP